MAHDAHHVGVGGHQVLLVGRVDRLTQQVLCSSRRQRGGSNAGSAIAAITAGGGVMPVTAAAALERHGMPSCCHRHTGGKPAVTSMEAHLCQMRPTWEQPSSGQRPAAPVSAAPGTCLQGVAGTSASAAMAAANTERQLQQAGWVPFMLFWRSASIPLCLGGPTNPPTPPPTHPPRPLTLQLPAQRV